MLILLQQLVLVVLEYVVIVDTVYKFIFANIRGNILFFVMFSRKTFLTKLVIYLMMSEKH